MRPLSEATTSAAVRLWSVLATPNIGVSVRGLESASIGKRVSNNCCVDQVIFVQTDVRSSREKHVTYGSNSMTFCFTPVAAPPTHSPASSALLKFPATRVGNRLRNFRTATADPSIWGGVLGHNSNGITTLPNR